MTTVAISIRVGVLVRQPTTAMAEQRRQSSLPLSRVGRHKTALNQARPNGCEMSAEEPVRLLVIEDEDRLSGILKSRLGKVGFAVDIAGSAADADAALELINYDAAVLDLGLPDGDGLAVLAAARRIGKALPILILTARDAVENRVAGLNAGADDYLTKPFEVRELLARVGAHLRRSEQAVTQAQPKTRFEFPGLIIDMNSRQVWRENQEVALTLTEFNLLSLLASQAGQVVSRGELLRKVWGYEVEIETRTVDAHVYRLRKKIERDSEKPHYIHSVPGIGYRFVAE